MGGDAIRVCLSSSIAALVALCFLGSAPGAAAGFEDGFPSLRVSMTGPAGPIPKGQAATYTAVVTNQGTGPATGEESSLSLSSYRVNGERPVPNPYLSVAPAQGSCELKKFPSRFGDYHSAECLLDTIPAGGSVEVTATVEINESMDHNAFVGFQQGGRAHVTTLVDSPPEITGSNKIRLSGVPDSCATGDFTLKAKAKGAKKMSATLRGPLNASGRPEDGGFSDTKKLKTVQGDKLTARIKAGSLDPAFYEVKLAAKYEDKPKQKAGILFQRCP